MLLGNRLKGPSQSSQGKIPTVANLEMEEIRGTGGAVKKQGCSLGAGASFHLKGVHRTIFELSTELKPQQKGRCWHSSFRLKKPEKLFKRPPETRLKKPQKLIRLPETRLKEYRPYTE